MKLILGILLLSNLTNAFAKDEKWQCMKDGQKVIAKGLTLEAKQKACENQKGTWEEVKPVTVKMNSVKVPPVVESPRQNAGGSGGW